MKTARFAKKASKQTKEMMIQPVRPSLSLLLPLWGSRVFGWMKTVTVGMDELHSFLSSPSFW